VIADELNLRPTPSTDQPPITQLAKGASVTIVGDQGNWYQVEVDGRQGWVHRAYVALDLSDLATTTDPVERAAAIVDQGGLYMLGTGDYNAHDVADGAQDLPWTHLNGVLGSDCAGFAISWCHRLVRHRPGFNHSPTATVSDDINTDSAIEDGQTKQELFEIVTVPQPGDLLVYKTFHVDGRTIIGHVAICLTGAPDGWDPAQPAYERLTVAQCKGPNGRKPGVIKTDGSIWSHHDLLWGDVAERRTVVLRVKPH
jgi:hypothetical protein